MSQGSDGSDLLAGISRRVDWAAGGFLDGPRVRIERADGHLWLVQADGVRRRISAVRPAFPLSLGPQMLVFYAQPDGQEGPAASEEEIGILARLSDLPVESQDLLAAEVEKAYFVPRIRQVLSITEAFGVRTWEVVTERGLRTFDITESNQVRFLEPARLVIKDVDGNRYQIEDIRLLDGKSQQWLDLQL